MYRRIVEITARKHTSSIYTKKLNDKHSKNYIARVNDLMWGMCSVEIAIHLNAHVHTTNTQEGVNMRKSPESAHPQGQYNNANQNVPKKVTTRP